MTTVTAASLNDGFLIECTGHAGYGDSGKDIVCAGVSALCMALEAMMEELADEGCAEEVRKHADDGFFSMEAHYAPRDVFAKERLVTVCRTVTAGLEAIAKLYPKYVQLYLDC